MSSIAIAYLAFGYVMFRIAVFYVDRGNLESAARRRGFRNPHFTWAPFAPGWLFENGERLYRVRYTDDGGNTLTRYCKVGFLTGVFWRD